MPDEAERITAFLAGAGWVHAERRTLTGDASSRRYERLTRGRDRAVLMVVPDGERALVARFAQVARHLASLGLSPPGVLAEDLAGGLLLLEDLGDALFARVASADPGAEAPLYAAASEMLAVLHAQPPPDFALAVSAAALAAATDVAWHWYAGGVGAPPFEPALRDMLDDVSGSAPVLALRDFHAENLIWLPDRAGPARVGLLDFQDAFAGDRAYDLVSLLEDARRDLGPGIREAALVRYRDAAGIADDDLRFALAVMGAQRNIRILGVFARLAARDGKPAYLRLIPRVWRHLEGDLAHPDLAQLRRFVLESLPPPGPETAERIGRTCAPTP